MDHTTHPPRQRGSHVAVIGAGVTGLSTAKALLHQDPSLRITILDQGEEQGSGCSYGPAAVLVFEPLPHFGATLVRLAKTLEVVNGWWRNLVGAVRFAVATSQEPRSDSEEARAYRQQCRRAWTKWLERLHPSTRRHVHMDGVSLILRDEQQVQQAREHVDLLHATSPGCSTRFSRDGGKLGCASLRSDAGGFVDPPRYLYALREELQATGRVRFRFKTTVTELRKTQSQQDGTGSNTNSTNKCPHADKPKGAPHQVQWRLWGTSSPEEVGDKAEEASHAREEDDDAHAGEDDRQWHGNSGSEGGRKQGGRRVGRPVSGSARATETPLHRVHELCDPADAVVLCTGAYGGHLLRSLGTPAARSVAQRLTPAWGWCATTTASQREVLDVPGGKGAGIVGDATQYFRRNTEDDERTLLDDGSMKLAGGLGFHLGGPHPSHAPPHAQMMQWALDVMPKHCKVMGTWGVIASGIPEVRLWCGARPWLTIDRSLTPDRLASWQPEVLAVEEGIISNNGGGMQGFIVSWEAAEQCATKVLAWLHSQHHHDEAAADAIAEVTTATTTPTPRFQTTILHDGTRVSSSVV